MARGGSGGDGRRHARERQRRKYVMISAVAERFDIHPQTLRLYEREGLIRPRRSAGNTRLYDEETLVRLETILTLTRDLGVNLAGVEVILNMRDQLEEMQSEMERLVDLVEGSAGDRRYALERVRSGLPVPRRHR
jgi:MerR family transcriptional regulator/heat shock protein HspR